MTDAVETTEDVETKEIDADEVDEAAEAVEDPNKGLKTALATERKLRRDAEREARDLKTERDNANLQPDEKALADARREAAAEATSKANTRIVRAEVKAAAVGKVKNPALALKLIDMSGIDVDDDGEVDPDALQAAIADLLTEYPELAADASRFGGGADQGARGKGAAASQLTQQDLDSMTPEQIGEARKSGRLNKILGVSK